MGGGSWTTTAYSVYADSRGCSVDAMGCLTSSVTGACMDSASTSQIFHQRTLDESLSPVNVMRECCDTEEHPETIPVILALDVTGSMGQTAVQVAAKLNQLMTKLYAEVKDIEFMVMGIGDLAYDNHPIQISQFESDIRIAEALDKIYMEFGGGSNPYESYTAAWYMGAYHTKLDCWTRGKRGILITMGDECLNPYLPEAELKRVLQSDQLGETETSKLFGEAISKFRLYHINVHHREYMQDRIKETWTQWIQADRFKSVKLDEVVDTIVEIIKTAIQEQAAAEAARPLTNVSAENSTVQLNEFGEVVW